MVRDLHSPQGSTTDSRARLNAHIAWLLDCPGALLYRPGVSIVPTERRRLAEWHGWLLPVIGVAPEGTGACVLSCLPELAEPLRTATQDVPPGPQSFSDPWVAAVRAIAEALEGAVWSHRIVFMADATTFRPHGVDRSVRAEQLDREGQSDLWLSHAFDGPCFLVRDGSGAIVAWAGVKCASDHAWEIAAVTEPAYQGRGLATVLTATAAEAILATGRLATWVADIHNVPSRRLVERLGFTIYGEQIAVNLFDERRMLPPPPASP